MRCSWHLVYVNCPQMTRRSSAQSRKGNKMSKTASIALNPSSTLFGRLLASIDRLLMTSAAIAVRNGDQPRFGL
jgi:hypothetical protein